MRLVITFDGTDLFVQGEWQSAYGAHNQRLTEDMPATVRQAAQTVAEWANAQEVQLRQGVEKQATAQNLRREIGRLEALERAALGRT